MSDDKLVPVKIGSVDEKSLEVYAQYNPKELQVDRSIPWTPHDKHNADGLQLEFTGGQGREMSLELFFDGVETDGSVGVKGAASVKEAVENLNKMARVRQPTSPTPDMRRPHHCVVTWGGLQDPFQCVITSIQTKYTMFKPGGEPLRATVTLKLKEASRVTMSKDSAKNAPPPPKPPKPPAPKGK